MTTISEIFSNKYKKRIEDLNNNCNDETIVEIYLNISREHFNMELVHSFELKNITKNEDNILLDILQYINLNEYIGNYLLTKYDITFFVPWQPLTYDIKENKVEICYHHDDVKYGLMKVTDDDEFIGVPQIGREELETLYVIDHIYRPRFKLRFFDSLNYAWPN